MELILSFAFTLLIVLIFNYVINRILDVKYYNNSRVLGVLVVQSAIIAVLLKWVL